MKAGYRLSPADTQRRIRDERDIYRNRWEAAERRIKELETRLERVTNPLEMKRAAS